MGVVTTDELLEAGATPQGRTVLREKTGIGDEMILKWVNRADLFRIKGIGEQYSDLLAAAGVETVLELAQRAPGHFAPETDRNQRVEKARAPCAEPGARSGMGGTGR